ncbi:hypothetical protein DFH07DRAFT_987323, partial [Mycena maculata]
APGVRDSFHPRTLQVASIDAPSQHAPSATPSIPARCIVRVESRRHALYSPADAHTLHFCRKPTCAPLAQRIPCTRGVDMARRGREEGGERGGGRRGWDTSWSSRRRSRTRRRSDALEEEGSGRCACTLWRRSDHDRGIVALSEPVLPSARQPAHQHPPPLHQWLRRIRAPHVRRTAATAVPRADIAILSPSDIGLVLVVHAPRILVLTRVPRFAPYSGIPTMGNCACGGRYFKEESRPCGWRRLTRRKSESERQEKSKRYGPPRR